MGQTNYKNACVLVCVKVRNNDRLQVRLYSKSGDSQVPLIDRHEITTFKINIVVSSQVTHKHSSSRYKTCIHSKHMMEQRTSINRRVSILTLCTMLEGHRL